MRPRASRNSVYYTERRSDTAVRLAPVGAFGAGRRQPLHTVNDSVAIPTESKREGQQLNLVGEQFLDWLVMRMKRLHAALNRFSNRQAPPAQSSQRETSTDQW